MEVLVGGSGRGDGGECGGRCVLHECYLYVKAAFAVRMAIPAAVVEEAMVGGSAGDGGERGGPCIHRNRYLRVKAAFLGRAKSLANTAFTARAAITAAVWCHVGAWCRGRWEVLALVRPRR